jgi:tetratricopeptide (TPR) repeat protein
VTDVDLPQAIVADPLFALHAGRVLSMSEDYDLAESVLAQIRAVARRDHAQVSLAIAMGALGEVWVRSGRFAAAAGVLDDAVALSLGTGQRAFVPFWFALRARVRSARGDHDGARADLDAGFGIAEELSLPGARYFLLAAAGLDALARGDAVGAIGHLEECRDFEDASDVLSPNVGRWRPDLVEAYCAVGDLDAARAALVPLRAAGGAEGAGRWTVASAARRRPPVCVRPPPASTRTSTASTWVALC